MEKCSKCGGNLSFSSEKQKLVCEICQHEIEINSQNSIGKRSLETQLQIEQPKLEGNMVIHCESCGADSSFSGEVISEKCSYCGSNLVNTSNTKFNYPDNIIPFEISKDKTKNIFKDWIQGLWFAPNALKNLINSMN